MLGVDCPCADQSIQLLLGSIDDSRCRADDLGAEFQRTQEVELLAGRIKGESMAICNGQGSRFGIRIDGIVLAVVDQRQFGAGGERPESLLRRMAVSVHQPTPAAI